MPAVITSQMMSRLYEDYKTTEVTFTKEIIHTLKMDPRQNCIKCGGSQWPCIINSTSFSLARIIIGAQGGAFQEIIKNRDQPMSLRFSFYQENGQLMSFFIAGKIQGIQPFGNNSELVIVTLQYTQRPPEDLILLVGTILDANVNSVRRKDERIVVTPDTLRKLSIPKKEITVTIDNIPRNCILANLSFTGASILLMGIAQFLKNKNVMINLEFEEPHEVIQLQGVIVNANPIEGRKDIVSANVQFMETSVTIPYKIRINNYLSVHKKQDSGVRFEGEAPVPSVNEAINQTAQAAAPAPEEKQEGTAPSAQA